MINYDTDRGIKVTKDGTSSTLTLNRAGTIDSGNYTCSPYNIRAASVLVHVLSEGNSAAAVQNNNNQETTKTKNIKDNNKSGNNNQAPPSAAVHSSSAMGASVSVKQVGIWNILCLALFLW